jgi:enhancing lycopene biosynthesis protein 2
MVRSPFTRVGVLLTGCGNHDGSEIGEALLTFLELERRGVQWIPLAPAGDQMHVVNHSTGDEMEGERRQMAAEVARLTRGRVELLGETPLDRLHALIVPGGGGTTKNLMTGYLQPGVTRELIPPVRELLSHCLAVGKPIGVMSIANFLLVGLLESPILPERAGTTSEPLVVDADRRLVYAPAFLTARSLAEVAEAVNGMVDLVLHYADEARRAAGEHG